MSENSPRTKALIDQLAKEWAALSDEELTKLIRETPPGAVSYMFDQHSGPVDWQASYDNLDNINMKLNEEIDELKARIDEDAKFFEMLQGYMGETICERWCMGFREQEMRLKGEWELSPPEIVSAYNAKSKGEE